MKEAFEYLKLFLSIIKNEMQMQREICNYAYVQVLIGYSLLQIPVWRRRLVFMSIYTKFQW